MSLEEKLIIQTSAEAALSFGIGILTNCQEQLEDHGYQWTEEHESYVFENYIQS